MPVTYQIDTENGIVYSVGNGVVTDDEMRNHQEKLAIDPSFDPSYRQLIDLSEVSELDVSSHGIWQRAHNDPWGDGARRAVVAASELALGLARMFQILSDGQDRIEVFRDLESAREWLGL